jgi:hypothetical protein
MGVNAAFLMAGDDEPEREESLIPDVKTANRISYSDFNCYIICIYEQGGDSF